MTDLPISVVERVGQSGVDIGAVERCERDHRSTPNRCPVIERGENRLFPCVQCAKGRDCRFAGEGFVVMSGLVLEGRHDLRQGNPEFTENEGSEFGEFGVTTEKLTNLQCKLGAAWMTSGQLEGSTTNNGGRVAVGGSQTA